jgi:hypothetical protein
MHHRFAAPQDDDQTRRYASKNPPSTVTTLPVM